MKIEEGLSELYSTDVGIIRDAEISRAFGVIQRGFSAGQVGWFETKMLKTVLTIMFWLVVQMRSGFPANSVFIVDTEDRVRHHTVLDPRF